MYIAVGHQARVGKDTFAARVSAINAAKGIQTHLVSFAAPLYEIAGEIQRVLNRPIKKDPALLQTVGTALKACYGEDVWAAACEKRIVSLMKADPSAAIIITDLRFPVEMEACKRLGFTTIKIVRKNRPIDRDPNHISETALAGAEFDHVLENDGDLDAYNAKVDAFMQAAR